jgi:sugar phosphate isomerase/epimerase
MRIGLAGWSLNRRFGSGELKLLDYPKVAVTEFGLKVIELNSPFFESQDDHYLKDLAGKIKLAGCEVANIAVDEEVDLASTNETDRREAVRRYAAWFHAADVVGSRCVRANAGGSRDEDATEAQVQACIRSFNALASIGATHGRKILIENHITRLGTNPYVLARIMQSDFTGYLGMLPDFGNFAPDVRYEALAMVMPWASLLHAKMHRFAEDGTETSTDMGRCIEIAKKTRFNGDVLIECEGIELSDHDAVLKAKALLERYVS